MVPLALAFRGLAHAVAGVWRDPETKALPVVAAALVLTGTLFYWRFEDWTIIESRVGPLPSYVLHTREHAPAHAGGFASSYASKPAADHGLAAP